MNIFSIMDNGEYAISLDAIHLWLPNISGQPQNSRQETITVFLVALSSRSAPLNDK